MPRPQRATRTDTLFPAPTYTTTPLVIDGLFDPVAGDYDGNGATNVLWYAPGPAADRLWSFVPGGSHASTEARVNGTYAPVAGDFDGNGLDDILWYARSEEHTSELQSLLRISYAVF